MIEFVFGKLCLKYKYVIIKYDYVNDIF